MWPRENSFGHCGQRWASNWAYCAKAISKLGQVVVSPHTHNSSQLPIVINCTFKQFKPKNEHKMPKKKSKKGKVKAKQSETEAALIKVSVKIQNS